jgi:hypothetical protein
MPVSEENAQPDLYSQNGEQAPGLKEWKDGLRERERERQREREREKVQGEYKLSEDFVTP